MSADREQAVTASFVHLATSLAAGGDVVDLLSTLTADCAALLDVASAGLLLADGRRVLHVLAASSERARDLEVFQAQREQGPCLDCYRSGEPVSVPDLSGERTRWPAFTAAAAAGGFTSVHALPLRLREQTLGALGLFGTSPGELNGQDLVLGQALADVASAALVQGRAASDATRDPTADATADVPAVTGQRLQAALSARVAVEQAKGVLAHSGGLDMQEAFARLRRYAADHGQRLSDVARRVVHGQLPAGDLLATVPTPPAARR